jgi:cyclomaltodextrinase
MSVPKWVSEAVFYQIFPDRFANGDKGNDPVNVQHWGSPPSTWGFQGGDFQGIIQHFDYLVDLGVNALYLNPIFLASSTHRYNTIDYFKIDPKLGDLKIFQKFLDLAHRHDFHVIIDGAFNHCGRGFFAFNDILENQEHSPYLNWFHITNFPVDAYSLGDARDYLAWWNIKSLPKFNTNNPEVRQYLLEVARYWIEQGVDGWRLDVPNEIDDDTFWAQFRSVVKAANPEAYLVGEIWTADRRWVGEEHFDGLMNYPVRDAILRLLQMGTLDIPHFKSKLDYLLQLYPVENQNAMYVPLGSHDTERLLTVVEGNLEKAKLAFLFQFAFPGVPAIYYGDEIGLLGGKDPECRAAFPWDERKWNHTLHCWVEKLVSLRKGNPVFNKGMLEWVCSSTTTGCLAFLRKDQSERVLVLMNPSPHTFQIKLSLNEIGWGNDIRPCSLMNGVEYSITQDILSITLNPWNGDWVKCRP